MIVPVTHFSMTLRKSFCEIGWAKVKDGPRIVLGQRVATTQFIGPVMRQGQPLTLTG